MQWCGSRTTADQDSPWWLSSPPESPKIPAIPEEIELSDDDGYIPDAVDPAGFDENEFFWQQIPAHDLQRVLKFIFRFWPVVWTLD
jgi:hypothetical protein